MRVCAFAHTLKHVCGYAGVTYPVGGVSPLINEMRRVAEARGKTVPQVAINYVICKGVIPIPGARDAKMAVRLSSRSRSRSRSLSVCLSRLSGSLKP